MDWRYVNMLQAIHVFPVKIRSNRTFFLARADEMTVTQRENGMSPVASLGSKASICPIIT